MVDRSRATNEAFRTWAAWLTQQHRRGPVHEMRSRITTMGNHNSEDFNCCNQRNPTRAKIH